MSDIHPLGARVPEGGTRDPDRILELFLDWVGEVGFELYPAQEEALLELFAGRHVILATPTGSGKSLVALGLHFKGLCEGRTSVYTSPIKALASEKFFALCDALGAERVGMLTGDASINPGAPVLCCTAEVLANMALRDPEADFPYVVMDEFHYYSDRARGVAWQAPLITLPHTRFLLMSATLGDVRTIAGHLERQTRFGAAIVQSAERPVPLEFEYRETPLLDTIELLHREGRTPAYVVNFTQRECAELAQGLIARKLASKSERAALREEIAGFRFDTAYGKELRRLIGFGIGVHHAGLLPKYRLLVEQLAQRGLLKVICGTDTLGVGVNIPIRTVLFSKLAKYDGRKVGILTVREFQQIAGRAGRKGFDDRGWVVCQAPEHVIEKRRAAEAGKKKAAKRKQPRQGEVSWTEETFQSLIAKPPEPLRSRFRIDHGMVLALLQRDAEANDPQRRNFAALREIVDRCHETGGRKQRLLAQAARLVRSLHRAGILKLERDTKSDYFWVSVDEELQREFAMHQPLSLFLVESLETLDAEDPDYPLLVLAFVEAILEDPKAVLYQQADRRKTELLGQLKTEGVPYEERIERLDEVTWPKPEADRIEEALARFRESHPWAPAYVSPKGIGREIWESYWTFDDFVRQYGLKRSEGVLLRYLSQLYKTLVQNVPEVAKSDGLYDLEGFLRALLESTDTSLLEEWESLLHPELRSSRADEREAARRALRNWELLHDPRALTGRVRAELHLLVRALSRGDWEAAAAAVRHDPDDPWDATRFEADLAPFVEAYGEPPRFDGEARLADKTQIVKVAPQRWEVRQILVDAPGDNLWHVAGEVDLSSDEPVDGPLVRMIRIGV